MDEPNINPFAVGRCNLMCPKEEVIMRQKNGLIHILETKGAVSKKSVKNSSLIVDPKRAVKCFQRSAAGKDLCNPNILRPPDVLLKTVTYLLSEIVLDNRLPWHETYDFICDRLRAVRQDLIIQQPPSEHFITILEPIVRFHIYSAYRLFESSPSEFDPKLNNSHLVECLKQILVFYDGAGSSSKCRSEMEALYLISNLGCADVLVRGLGLPHDIMNDDLKLAMKLSLAWYCKNYVIIFRDLKLLTPLLQACLALQLPEIRRHVLKVMSVAYSSKNACYPLDCLASLLLYDSEAVLKEECNYYNINTSDNCVKFLKSSFDSSRQVQRRKTKCVTETLDSVDLPQLLLNSLRFCED